jgi:hypothetical protein
VSSITNKSIFKIIFSLGACTAGRENKEAIFLNKASLFLQALRGKELESRLLLIDDTP